MVIRSFKGEKKWRSAAARVVVGLSGAESPPETAVEKIASELLENISHPPTDLDALAQKLGVSEIVAEDIPFSGELRRERSELILRYGSHLPQGRKRFTIAHELGHAVLLRAGLSLPHKGTEVERLCDLLASALLMPPEVFVRSAQPICLSGLFDVARQFDVSLAAAAVRCASLLDVSLFQISGDRIQWGYGKYRRGPLSVLHPKLRFLDARSARHGQELILMDAVLWRVEWTLRERDDSLLVLLSPKSKTPSKAAAQMLS